MKDYDYYLSQRQGEQPDEYARAEQVRDMLNRWTLSVRVARAHVKAMRALR